MEDDSELTVAVASITGYNRDRLTVYPDLLLARLSRADRGELNLPAPRGVALARTGRLGVGDLNITHPQEAQALFVQAYGRTTQQACARCSQSVGGDGVPDLVFARCRTRGQVGNGACGDCLYRHNAIGCSFHPLHSEPVPPGGVVASVESTPDVAAGQRRGTRASTRQHGDELVPAGELQLRRPRRTRSSAPVDRRRTRSPSLAPRPRDSPPREEEGESETIVDPRPPGLSYRQRFAWFWRGG